MEKEFLFVKEVIDLVNYWSKQQQNEFEKLHGVAFSILALIDNNHVGVPECKLIFDGEYIHGGLHEIFYPLSKLEINSLPLSVNTTNM